MKIFTLLLSTAIFLFNSYSVGHAQELKSKKVKVSYQHAPEKHIPSYIKTYALKFTNVDPKSFYTGGIFIPKLTKVNDRNEADMIIEISSSKLDIKSKKIIKEVKKVDGENKTYRGYKITYSKPVSILIYNRDKTAFFKNTKLLQYEDYTLETSKGIYSEAALANVVTDKEIIKLCNVTVTNKIKSNLKKDFGYKDAYVQYEIFVAKSKKSDYEELTEAYSRFKSIFESKLGTQLSQIQASELKEIVYIWQQALIKGEESSNTITIQQINYNLAVGNAWLGNFKEARANILKTEGLDAETIKNFTKWLTGYENKYLMSNFDYKFEKILYGQWQRVDLNYMHYEKGKVSLVEKIEGCDKDYKMTFKKNKNVTIDYASGCESENQFWRVYGNNKSEQKYLIWDAYIDELGKNANSVFKFKSINSNQFEITGPVYINKEAYEEAVAVFKKISD